MRSKKPPEIPPIKSEGTYIYLAEEGKWPEKPHVILTTALFWLQEGMLLELQDLRPSPAMGTLMRVRIVQVRPQVRVFPGWYGQVVVYVLVEPFPDEGEVLQRVEEVLDGED